MLSGLELMTSQCLRQLELANDIIIQGHRIELGDLKLMVYTVMGAQDDLQVRNTKYFTFSRAFKLISWSSSASEGTLSFIKVLFLRLIADINTHVTINSLSPSFYLSVVFKVGSGEPQGSFRGFQEVPSKTQNNLFYILTIKCKNVECL